MHGIFIPAALLTLAAATPARLEHAKINLEVTAKGSHEAAFVDQTPPDWGKNPRPVVKARAGEPIKVQYTLTNVYPHKTLENVVVHFFIARQGKAAQAKGAAQPRRREVHRDRDRLRDGLPRRGAKAESGGRSIKVDTPGAYLVRIETRQTQSDHEHFAAIDLVVE